LSDAEWDFRTSEARKTRMRKTKQVGETAGNRSAGAATHEAPPTVGAGAPLIGKLIRLVRLRSHKAVAGEDANDAVSPSGRKLDHDAEVARSSIEAGLTRGASQFFSGRR
jgi:hypothetical protein